MLSPGAVPVHVAAEARQFTGEIEDFGPLEKEQKKQIRKALRVMCRECQMGVAVAQLALTDAAIQVGTIDPDRIGISFGTDYMLSLPEEFNEGIRQCLNGEGKFEFPRWGLEGLPKMSPLWLLKYLPNMPASHVAIFNDLRGPSNSLTMREAGSNLAVGEAYQIIRRGNADAMVCGATGTRLHAMKIVHAVSQEEVACGDGDPTKVSRPFDRNRSGMVLGEGAGAIVIEELAHAQARGATIYGEIVAASSRAAAAPPACCPAKSGPGQRAAGVAARLRLPTGRDRSPPRAWIEHAELRRRGGPGDRGSLRPAGPQPCRSWPPRATLATWGRAAGWSN